MDNGLIFPYPRRNAHAEPADANHPNQASSSERVLGSVGPGVVVGKRWGDAGR
jgi:hypothetical protein